MGFCGSTRKGRYSRIGRVARTIQARREADVFALFAEQRRLRKVDLLVRAKHNRSLGADGPKWSGDDLVDGGDCVIGRVVFD